MNWAHRRRIYPKITEEIRNPARPRGHRKDALLELGFVTAYQGATKGMKEEDWMKMYLKNRNLIDRFYKMYENSDGPGHSYIFSKKEFVRNK